MKFQGHYEEEYNEDIFKISTDIFSFLVSFLAILNHFLPQLGEGKFT